VTKQLSVASAIGLAVASVALACCQRQGSVDQRETTWATAGQARHVRNFYQVAPGVFRGAQPDAQGFAELERMGIRTVINLRGLNSDRDELGHTRLAYRHIIFHTWHPEDEDVVEFLRIVTKPENQPVFFHCQHGSDRTGTMCAIYRMAVQGWSADQAIAEMTGGGYGFHPMWSNLLDYLRRLDVGRVKREAGLL
jgi:protein tyrosine phosphatase (PTP) superfamily phosphohydrolase (DUF442 family)